jgi:hypothetical protein
MDNTPLLGPSGGEHDASATAASSSSNPPEQKKPGMMKARWKNIVKTKVETIQMSRQLFVLTRLLLLRSSTIQRF